MNPTLLILAAGMGSRYGGLKQLDQMGPHGETILDYSVKYAAEAGYGKVVLRMNNYTVEGRYLLGYTPDYTLNVGVKPHQDYPHTWNFTSISSGEVEGLADNVYNNIKSDHPNRIKIANAADV